MPSARGVGQPTRLTELQGRVCPAPDFLDIPRDGMADQEVSARTDGMAWRVKKCLRDTSRDGMSGAPYGIVEGHRLDP